jgi:hypothetical protein
LETKATNLPSSDISDCELVLNTWVSLDLTDTLVVVDPNVPSAAPASTAGPTVSATTTAAPSTYRVLGFIAALPLSLPQPQVAGSP